MADESKCATNLIQNGDNGINSKRVSTTLTEVEGKPKKLPYPKSVFFIISNEFCERFNFYGMRTILALYLTDRLLFDQDKATLYYHAFAMLVYVTTIFGAIISDSWWGKFKTIMWLSIVYAIGSLAIAIGAIPTLTSTIGLSDEHSMTIGIGSTILGLLLISIGSGGIKPCVAAFGGDQFKLPAQAAQMATYFSLFYFSINAGSLISTAVTPVLRQDVRCFGGNDCFSLAFGVPGALMIASIIVFVFGRPLYKMIPPSENMVVKVSSCIKSAIVNKKKEKKVKARDHWLDYAEETHGQQLVSDVKILLKVLVLYIPLPLFWALFDQQGSRWTFQATRMNGDIGFYDVKPDQMQVINPLLILIFIPLYEAIFYPLLAKVGLKRPLQKLTSGGILAGVAFLLSALVEMELEKTYPVLPQAHEAQLRIFNGLGCDYTAITNITNHKHFTLKSMQMFQEKYINVDPNTPSIIKYAFTSTIDSNVDCPKQIQGEFILSGGTAKSYFVNGKIPAKGDLFIDNPDKSLSGNPSLRLLITTSKLRNILIRTKNGDFDSYKGNTDSRIRFDLPSDDYNIFIDNILVTTVELRQGSVYTILIREIAGGDKYIVSKNEIIPPNTLNMMWLLPQYIVMTLGEVMFSVTGLAFSYSQAPESMKSVLQAFWLLNVAFGNVVVMVIAVIKIKSQTYEFLLFAILMFVDMFIFMVLAYQYKSVDNQIVSETNTETEVTKTYSDDVQSTETVPVASVVPSNVTTAEIELNGQVNETFKKD